MAITINTINDNTPLLALFDNGERCLVWEQRDGKKMLVLHNMKTDDALSFVYGYQTALMRIIEEADPIS